MAALVVAASAGDAQAEAFVLRRVTPGVRVYARRRLKSHADTEEFVQDVLVRLVQSLRSGKIDEPAGFGAFALGICHNLTRNAARKRERREELWARYGEAADVAVQACELEAHERHAHLEDCLGQLTVRAREVIGRTFYDEATGTEIADALEITPGNVRVIRTRALSALRECLSRASTWEGTAA
jgi:RNA polymerase sigma-70 factor (ECF subfamily)